MTKDKRIIAIMGKSGAGKDTVFNKVREKAPTEFNYIKRVTTRPRRPGESNDAYFFIDRAEYWRLFTNNKLVEIGVFGPNWFYGTPDVQIIKETINIGVFDPGAILQLIDEFGPENVKVVSIDCPKKDRLLRYLKRTLTDDDVDEAIRRFLDDDKSFIKYYYDVPKEVDELQLTNASEKDLNACANAVVTLAQMWKTQLS